MKKFPFELGLVDFNGTIQDDLPVCLGSIGFICTKTGVPTPKNLRKLFQTTISNQYMRFYRNLGISEEFSKEDLDGMRKEYYREHRGDGELLTDGALQMLEELFSLTKLAIVSGEVKGYVPECLAHLGVNQFFDSVYDGAHDKMAVFQDIASAYELPYNKMFYVDDSAEGLENANKLGITTIGFVHKGSYNSEERIFSAEPKGIIYSLSELIPMLESF